MPDTQVKQTSEDSATKADDVLTVGEDLNFQRRWWRFEKAIWVVFVMILLADVLGVFGRGYLSKAERTAPDQSFRVKYERTERASTPSIMTVELSPDTVHQGQVQLFASESIIRELGNQRISPQPERSVLTPNGIIYTFGAEEGPISIQFALEPSFPGLHNFSLQVPGFSAIHSKIIVVP